MRVHCRCFKNVTQILLIVNSFTGSIPTEYGLLGNLTELRLDYNFGINGTVPSELTECNKLTLLSLYNTEVSGNVTFCDSFGDNLVIRVTDVSVCGKECECCCETFLTNNTFLFTCIALSKRKMTKHMCTDIRVWFTIQCRLFVSSSGSEVHEL